MKEAWGLIVDTTIVGAHLLLVKFKDENSPAVIHLSSCLDNRSSAAKLSVSVQKMLEIYDLEVKDLEKVIVANGPGTFTGIKIGLSFVAALSLANPDLKIMAVSGLEQYAKAEGKNSLCFLPATKSQGYASYFDGSTTRMFSVEIIDSCLHLKPEGSSESIDFKELSVDSIKTLKNWTQLSDLSSLEVIEESVVFSTYKSLLAINEQADWSRASVGSEIEPRYLRRSAPEEKLIQEGKLK